MNVIVIVADSWQFNYLGCYGNDWIQTPNIDALAAEGVVFENAYAEGCPTVPTRRALLTGRYTLPYGGWAPLSSKDTTITDILWHEGMIRAMVSDTSPMQLPRFGYSRSFDQVHFIRGQEFDHFYRSDPCTLNPDDYHKPAFFDDPARAGLEKLASLYCRRELMDYLPQRQHWTSDEDQMAAKVCQKAVEWLEQRDRTRPFLLWVDSFDPHEPWDPPSVWSPELKCPYDPDYEGKEIINPVPTYVDGYLTEQEQHHIRMLYAEKITVTDKWLGKLLDKIRNEGLFEDTLVVFLSDHGQPLGNGEHGHGIIRKCRPWPYEELVHIPLVVRCPGVKPGRVSAFVQTVDVAPTIMDFLGVTERTGHMQGQSLLPLMRGDAGRIRDFAIAGYYNFSWSIITEEWSYIHWLDDKHFNENPMKAAAAVGLGEYQERADIWTCTPGSEGETPESDELYARQADPFQLNNLIEKNPDTASQLNQQLREFMLTLKTQQ